MREGPGAHLVKRVREIIILVVIPELYILGIHRQREST